MNELLLNRLEEMFKVMNNTPEIRELIRLKKEIYSDKDLAKDLEELRSIKEVYSEKYINLKKKIVMSDKVMQFHKLEDELYFTILESNKKLEELFNKKGCK